jgi:hypothetical protein
MNKASLSSLVLSAALSLGPVVSRAQDTRPPGGRAEGDGQGRPGLHITPGEREKLRAVYQQISGNEKVRAADAAMREAAKNLQAAREEAMAELAAQDSSLEPILKKMKETVSREGDGGRRRGEGDGFTRGLGSTSDPRPPGEPQTRRFERPEGERPSRPRPEALESERPRRPEGERPARPQGARDSPREDGAQPRSR